MSQAAILQIDFVHEDSGQSFILDIADLVRHDVTLPIAFGAAKLTLDGRDDNLERTVRKRAAETFNRERVVSKLIDHIKTLFALPTAGDISERLPTTAKSDEAEAGRASPSEPLRKGCCAMPLCIVVTRDVEMRYRGLNRAGFAGGSRS